MLVVLLFTVVVVAAAAVVVVVVVVVVVLAVAAAATAAAAKTEVRGNSRGSHGLHNRVKTALTVVIKRSSNGPLNNKSVNNI